MACMFTMMNEARLAVGLQGVAIAEAATQQAIAYARERRQGRTPGHAGTAGESVPIIAHPDVRRMLITMRALDPRGARDLLCDRRRARPRRARRRRRRAPSRRTSAPRCSRRSPRRSRPTSAARSPRSASRSMAAWASSRRPAPPSTIATPASPRSTKAPTASRRSTSSPASCRFAAAARCAPISTSCAARVDAVQAANDPAFGATGDAARRGDRQPRARDRMAAGAARRPRPTRRSPAPRPICACSRSAAGGCMLAEEALAAARHAERRRRGQAGPHRDRALLRRESSPCRRRPWRASSPRAPIRCSRPTPG